MKNMILKIGKKAGTIAVLCLPVLALVGFSSSAKADTCSGNQVVTGFACSVGDYNFTFEAVNLTNPQPGDNNSLFIESPPTGGTSSVTLGFQVVATYPTDIHLVYEVQSTAGPIINQVDSSFTPASGPPAPMINETVCSVDPELHGGTCPQADVLANYTNTTGDETFSLTFGPDSTVWIDKDITDPGFSSFTDSVDGTSATPEPSSLALLGTTLLGAAGLARRRLMAR